MEIIINTFKVKYVLFMFTFLLLGLNTYQLQAQVKSSKISFIETKHDFGKVQQGRVLTYIFKFQNNGEDSLEIKNVRASCGCTGAAIGEKKKFANGEEGEIKVTFDTNGRTGVQNKTVSVQTNDPENLNVMLSFTCEIVSK
ncbi:MAG: DUF1573 domain-containing protein [Stygiobacter sp.]|jgi:hypothetical protein|uniref:DUF1573 domain-containing protein n=1 Tax=Stygiobacter electus TaxID=3032292 RepID=A0AAE3TEE0_9BACT|nr:DUF1573 domain-containing protein [Stygiobacter electus]MDF1612332.1 DUF1573 domain-containing protein [Stygiobacter electus]